MSNEYYAAIRRLIDRSLENSESGRYSYICIQWDDEEGDHSFTFRVDKGKETIEIDEEESDEEQH